MHLLTSWRRCVCCIAVMLPSTTDDDIQVPSQVYAETHCRAEIPARGGVRCQVLTSSPRLLVCYSYITSRDHS